MPGDATATTPDGRTIDFFEESHQYICRETGQHFTSGTSVVKKMCKPFDPTGEITQRYAAKHCKTVQQVKAEWKAKADASCTFGTRVHEFCEGHIANRTALIHTPINEIEQHAFAAGLKMVKHLLSIYRFVAAEQMVASHKMGIAGTVDLLMADDASKTLVILDWKTNLVINTLCEYGNKMLGMLSHLDQCELNTYSIQLGLYDRIIIGEGYLEANNMAGWKTKKVILHIPREPGEIVRWIECRDLSREVMEVIVNHLTDIPF